MRQSLIFGGLESMAHNINRKSPDLMFYEFGNVYFCNPEAQISADRPLAPFSEDMHLGIWLTGDMRPANWARQCCTSTFFDIKAVVANVFARLGISEREIELKKGSSDLFASSLAITTRSGKFIGEMGIVSKAVAKSADVKAEVYFAELNWNAIMSLALGRNVTYAPLPKTQPVKRDLALLIDSSVTMEQIEQVVRKSEKRLLRSVELFDVYEGKNLPEGKKSYAISIALQDDEKTLQDKYIDQVMSRIIDNLKKQLSAELR